MLRGRRVAASGDASAALCERVAGIVVVVGGRRVCWCCCWWERVVWCGVGGEVRKVSKEKRDSIAPRARVRALVLLIPYCQAARETFDVEEEGTISSHRAKSLAAGKAGLAASARTVDQCFNISSHLRTAISVAFS